MAVSGMRYCDQASCLQNVYRMTLILKIYPYSHSQELGLSPAPYDIGDEDDSIVLPRAPLLIYCVSLPALADTVVPQLPSRVEFSGFLAAPAPTSTLIQEMESLSLFLEVIRRLVLNLMQFA